MPQSTDRGTPLAPGSGISPLAEGPGTPRRLTLSDLMILLAAAGITLAWVRGVLRFSLIGGDLRRPPQGWTPLGALSWAINSIHIFILLCLATATLALLAIRLVPPRPSRPGLAEQPGAVACASATLAMAVGILEFLAVAYAHRFGKGGFAIPTWSSVFARGAWDFLYLALADSMRVVGYAVAAAWMVLVLGRRWNPERGWIDRLGRALGAAWIVMSIASVADRVGEMLMMWGLY